LPISAKRQAAVLPALSGRMAILPGVGHDQPPRTDQLFEGLGEELNMANNAAFDIRNPALADDGHAAGRCLGS